MSCLKYHSEVVTNTLAIAKIQTTTIVSGKVTDNRGALSFRKQVHALIFKHKIISKHPQNMRFSRINACTFMRRDTICMFEILNELVEIHINDHLISADKRTRGGNNL